MVYQFKSGKHVPAGADPRRTYEALMRVRKSAGTLTSQTLADAAEADDADEELIPWFTFDTEIAVRKLHVIEAGELIRSIVVVELTDTQREPVRALVLMNNNGKPEFEPIMTVLRSRNKTLELIEQVRLEKEVIDSKFNEILALIELTATASKK